MRVLVIGAGLAGLAAAERLLDRGVEVVVVDSFPRPGGRTANFDASSDVAGLIPGDVVEHGLHAWFQHDRALFGLMARAGVPTPPFAGEGVHLWNPEAGHVDIPVGPFMWLVRAMGLPVEMRGQRRAALVAFGRLIAQLDAALTAPAETDRESAEVVFARAGVPEEAVRSVFAPCLYSLTSLPLSELSGLEMLRWMAAIIPDPRIRVLQGGGAPEPRRKPDQPRSAAGWRCVRAAGWQRRRCQHGQRSARGRPCSTASIDGRRQANGDAYSKRCRPTATTNGIASTVRSTALISMLRVAKGGCGTGHRAVAGRALDQGASGR